MLKQTLRHFYDLADAARVRFGDNAPKVTNGIIEQAFPNTCNAAMDEGCDRMFRDGVKAAVSKYIRKPGVDSRQRTFDDITPDLLPLVEDLGSVAYYVPGLTGGEYVGVPDLCANPGQLNAARAFMRQKGEECLSEAKRLDDLYAAVIGGSSK